MEECGNCESKREGVGAIDTIWRLHHATATATPTTVCTVHSQLLVAGELWVYCVGLVS